MHDFSSLAPAAPGSVALRRGRWIESRHRVHAVVVEATGRVLAVAGDPRVPTFFRSAAKPFQALPLVEDGVVDALALDGASLALCCASHNSEPRHVELARAILARAAVPEGALACGGHPPLRLEEARRIAAEGRAPGSIESNCSGKHSGMLALARHHGWPLEGYERPDHPVQRRMCAVIARWAGLDVEALETAVDGCGVVCVGAPLVHLALAYARLAGAAREPGSPAGRVVRAMVTHPAMVGGSGRLDTGVMEATGGRVFAKVGAEGVYGAGVPERGLGIALKVEDGGWRAADRALVALLDALGVTDPEADDAIAPFRRGAVLDTRGDAVGAMEAEVPLEWM